MGWCYHSTPGDLGIAELDQVGMHATDRAMAVLTGVLAKADACSEVVGISWRTEPAKCLMQVAGLTGPVTPADGTGDAGRHPAAEVR